MANLRMFILASGLVMMASMSGHAANEPLDFGFLKSPPGKRVHIGSHNLHINCRGSGEVTVVFEAGLGGSALEWNPVVDLLGEEITTCVYDRAGYGWSDPSPHAAHATRLAVEANQLLKSIKIDGPILLVGHSFGGLIIRRLADLDSNNIVGMVLIDASHEDQLKRFEALGGASLVPTGDNFVVRVSGVPENLPAELSRKIDAMSRLRKTYTATHGELSNFRLSIEQVTRNRKKFDFPVKVVSRGISPYADDETGKKKTAIWKELQEDLINIGAQGDLTVASNSGHHVHVDEPGIIKQAITDLLNDYQEKQSR